MYCTTGAALLQCWKVCQVGDLPLTAGVRTELVRVCDSLLVDVTIEGADHE